MSLDKSFIQTLAKNGTKKPLPHFLKLLAGFLTISLIYFCSISFGIFSYNGVCFIEYFFTVDSLLMLITGFLALVTACKLMYPDRCLSKIEKILPFIPLGILFTYFINLTLSYDMDVLMSCLLMNDMMCFVKLFAISILPVIVGTYVLSKGFVTQSKLAGVNLILAFASFGYIILRIFEIPMNPLQMFIWHFIPVTLLLFLGIMFGKLLNTK